MCLFFTPLKIFYNVKLLFLITIYFWLEKEKPSDVAPGWGISFLMVTNVTVSAWFYQRFWDVNLDMLEVVSLHQKTQHSNERSGTFENEIMRNENYNSRLAPYIFLIEDLLTFEKWRPVPPTWGWVALMGSRRHYLSPPPFTLTPHPNPHPATLGNKLDKLWNFLKLLCTEKTSCRLQNMT